MRMARTLSGDQQAGRKSFVSYFNTHPADDYRLAVWQEGVAAVRRGQRTPMSAEQAREVAAERRRADAEAGRRHAERERWRVFLSEECQRIHARYPDCAMFTGKTNLFAECPPILDAPFLQIPKMQHEECACPDEGWLFRVPVSECKPPVGMVGGDAAS